ncbi:MAG: GH92 family glycosyl hydrolase [Cyclobacteriaceae bacterium]
MKRVLGSIVVVIFFTTASFAQEDLTKYIDPTIGNVAPFLVPTHPAMHLPNQMLRMFPMKKDYISDQVDAFPLQIISYRSPGMLPMKVVPGDISDASWKQKMTIDHDLEVTRPWFYSAYLIDDDIRVSFTPARKCAIYKFDFSAGEKKNILIRGSNGMTCEASGPAGFSIEEKIKHKIRGIKPTVTEVSVFVYAELVDAEGQASESADIEAKEGKLSISVEDINASTVYLKYAVSYISHQQAKANFESELADKGFGDLVNEGKKIWQEKMSQVQVVGATEAQKRTFYTSLYRYYWRMIDINEGGRYFSGFDNKVHESDRPFYTNDSVWDTFRAMHPLRTILDPQMENEILNSYTLMYEQGGWMPTYPILNGNRMSMNGYHSVAIFIDGYRKGLRDYDVETAYEGIKKNLTQGTFIPWRQGTPKRGIDEFYSKNGYFPSLRPGQKETDPMVDDFEKRQPVPVTLGISFDYWALGQFSKELGKEEDHQIFSHKANDYKNLWHPEERLFIPKDENGDWVDIDPKLDGGRGFREYYDENNGWSYAWDVQHDIAGLAGLLGGKNAAEHRLDQLFREPLGIRKSDFYVNGSNSTGLVGQFAMGNEMSYHIPYLYNYFGAPWKTQKRTRFLLDVWFKDNIFGFPGDEDGGGMSPFVVFSCLGFYPVTPGLPFYAITSPVFEKSSIKLKNGKTFTVLAKGASKTKKYIHKAFINGEEIDSPFISHDQVMSGATLELILDELPNKEWGRDGRMPEF